MLYGRMRMTKDNARIDAIVFDADGVLFNTEPLHMRAWENVLAAQGVRYDERFYLGWVGVPDEELAVYLTARHGPCADPSGYLEAKRAAVKDLVRRELAPFPGVTEALERFAGRVPLAVATSSPRALLDLMLEKTGLARFFDVTLAYNDVARSKPDPQIFELAVARLGANPERTAALEDSPTGVRAARAAGLLTVGVTSSFPAEELDGCAATFPTTAEACDWVAQRARLSAAAPAPLKENT